MPTQPTYPGVYIEEIPSGVRTLTGVATSLTAFVGRAQRGTLDEPITIFSYADFERAFGGLWIDSKISYAVRDFYLNGGSQAIVIRRFNEDTGNGIATVTLPGATNGIILDAANPGLWGNSLKATVDHTVAEDAPSDAFNLTITEFASATEVKSQEVFRNVVVGNSNEKHPRYLPAVLENTSKLIRMIVQQTGKNDNADQPTEQSDIDFTGGDDGNDLVEADLLGNEDAKSGMYALDKADIFNLLCIPDILSFPELREKAVAYCLKRRAMLIIDPKPSSDWPDAQAVDLADVPSSTNAALYFPRLLQPDPLRDNQLVERPPCGAIAGVIARTDAQRGIWKAPAGLEATINGAPKLAVPLTDENIGLLNPLGVNCLKAMPPAGRVVWGARTRKGDDRLASEWKYVPIRRLALYIEESLYRGTQWVVFEPNDEPLWAQIRLNLGAFMNDLFRKGAFQGSSPADAYFVKCDKETTTQSDINLGIVNIVVGFAPLKPAEFVIIKLQQIAGQLAA
ncbi:MAG: phage tail sheath subtilisin-like domain-containing protein [Proteobacteria bacterium]|nr:phage tail sheath subtilisin-like domain-containing protein [Pseudomonadota bacterium]